MARERKQEESPGGAPEWMNTYGDMVTLLLTFFVLLFSFSNIDKQKWQQVVMSLSGGPGIMDQAAPIDPNQAVIPRPAQVSPSPTPSPAQTMSPADVEKQERVNEEFDELYRQIMGYVQANRLEGLMVVERQEGYVLLSFKEKMLFAGGSADLNEDSKSFLSEIFMMLEGSQDSYRLLRIEGHTDTVPIRTARFLDNWDLSVSRATSVLRFINDGTSIEATKLFAGGYGEMRPVASNDTEEGKARNRRVDIVCERRDLALEKRQAETEVIVP